METRLALLFEELERRADEDDELDAERERQRERRRIEQVSTSPSCASKARTPPMTSASA
jgi:hypothetical protein